MPNPKNAKKYIYVTVSVWETFFFLSPFWLVGIQNVWIVDYYSISEMQNMWIVDYYSISEIQNVWIVDYYSISEIQNVWIVDYYSISEIQNMWCFFLLLFSVSIFIQTLK
jgi:hypothetical protein